ncbi:MAG: Lrp/AsnC ligand binding domain-containing protein [Sulfolobales archaeon]
MVLVVGVRAYILVTTSIGSEYEVLNDLVKIVEPDIKIEADVVYGEYDLVVILEAADLGSLDRVITQMRKHPKIMKTTTLISSKAR